MSAADTEQKLVELCKLFDNINETALKNGVAVEDLYEVFVQSKLQKEQRIPLRKRKQGYGRSLSFCISVLVVIIGLALTGLSSEDVVNTALGIRCVVPNNFLVWEATRPIADCGICRGIDNILVLHNVSRKEFEKYAYSYRPILVKKAAAHWPAMKTFSYDFFKELYEATEGAYQSVEDECQLLTFKTEFLSLKDVFSMSRSRVLNLDGEQPWYIGW